MRGAAYLYRCDSPLPLSSFVRYVDPLNVLQAEVLRRIRYDSRTGAGVGGGEGGAHTPESEEEMRLLHDALSFTMNGIAAGMRNTG